MGEVEECTTAGVELGGVLRHTYDGTGLASNQRSCGIRRIGLWALVLAVVSASRELSMPGVGKLQFVASSRCAGREKKLCGLEASCSKSCPLPSAASPEPRNIQSLNPSLDHVQEIQAEHCSECISLCHFFIVRTNAS